MEVSIDKEARLSHIVHAKMKMVHQQKGKMVNLKKTGITRDLLVMGNFVDTYKGVGNLTKTFWSFILHSILRF